MFVINLFNAVNQRSSLQRNTTTVRRNATVRIDAQHVHRQLYVDTVSAPPRSLQADVPVNHLDALFPPIDLNED